MKSVVINIIAIVALLTTGSALATDMPPFAMRYGCVACHTIDKRMIGPSWMEISKAYNDNTKTSTGIPISEILRKKTAEEFLKMRIAGGGAGTWGMVMMPPSDPAKIGQGDIDRLVTGIMGLSKGGTPKEEFVKLSNLHGCKSCHSMDKKNIGPSWMDISKFYNNSITSPHDGLKASDVLKSRTAEEWLLFKISHGGQGNWGMRLMPALEYRYITLLDSIKMDHDNMYDEFNELAKFIMGLAKR